MTAFDGLGQAVYSEIPVRTWNWLGVNVGYISHDTLAATANRARTYIEPGKSVEQVYVARQAGRNFYNMAVGEGATAELTVAALAPEDSETSGAIKIRVAKGGKLRLNTILLGSRRDLSSIEINLIGDDSTAEINALYFTSGEQKFDLNYIIRQFGERTKAAMNVYGALGGQSEKIFRGTLDFVKGCSGSAGREKEEVLLLSPDVRNRSVPLMLSGEEDVDGRHAASIGQIEESRLYYLMSRGLDETAAKQLIVEAMFAPVLDRLSDKNLRAEIEALIERKTAACF